MGSFFHYLVLSAATWPSYAATLLSCLGYFLRGRLHDVVARRTLDAVLIRVVINDRVLAAEIVEWRRRRGRRPLERGCLPGVGRRRNPFEAAVDKVKDKDELHCSGEEGRISDEPVNRHQRHEEVIGKG